MAKKPETRFGDSIDPLLRNIPESVWFNIQQLSIRGTPDRLGCISGTFIALELKASEKDYTKGIKGIDSRTKLQQHNINKINNAGGYGTFLYPENWDEVYPVLIAISEGRWGDG